MDNLIRIKQIIDHSTKEPFYPATHAIGVGYTDKNGECITVQEALDSLKNTFETLSEYYLTLGYGENQAFPGNEGKALLDAFENLANQYVTIDYFNNELSIILNTKQDLLESGENIKTINKESLLIDENTPENKKNFSLSNSDEYAKIDPETLEEFIKYKALAQGEEQMLVLKSMGPNFDILDLPVIPYDEDNPYRTNLLQYDLNDDGKIDYTELAMLYTFLNIDPNSKDGSTQSTDSPNPIYDEGNGFKYTYKKEKINSEDDSEDDSGDNAQYKLFLYRSENDGPWEKMNGKTVDMSAYNQSEINNAAAEDDSSEDDSSQHLPPVEDCEITTADITAWQDIVNYIAAANNIQTGQDFEEETSLFAIFDPKASWNKKIKIGYNFNEYIKNKSSDYILFECAPSKNVIYCNSFTGKLYRWSTKPNSTMIEVYADSHSRAIIKILSNQVNTLLNTTQNILKSGNIKTINNKSLLIDENTPESSKNLSLSNSDDIAIIDEESAEEIIRYKALAQGEEQMCVLRYADIHNLPAIQTNDTNKMYDYDDDGVLTFNEILLIYSILMNITIYDESEDLSTLTPDTLASEHHIEMDNYNRDKLSFAYTKEGNNYFLWTALFDADTSTWGCYVKQQEEQDGEIVPSKILDVSGDGIITTTDATELYTIMLYNGETDSGTIPLDTASFYEFIGPDKIFASYETKNTLGLNQNRIIIGYDFLSFLRERNNDTLFRDNPYVITTLKPNPNVIYCDCSTNNLYRYVKLDGTAGRLELIYNNKTASRIQQMERHIQILEEYVESQGGVIYHDEPGEPIDPGRL